MCKKTLNFIVLFSVLSVLTFAMQSCQSDDFESDGLIDMKANIEYEDILTIDKNDITQIEKYLSDQGVEFTPTEDEPMTKAIIVDDLLLRVIKVSCKAPHPDGSNRTIDASGVLIVPRLNFITKFFNYRLLVVPPPTYVTNSFTPSVSFANGLSLNASGEINYLYAYTLFAWKGFAVFIPDYPGFGDSYKQCTMPYLESKPMVTNLLHLVKAAQRTLSANGYRYKDEIAVTGASQGGFVAASFVRELETNSAHGLNPNLLFTAGTPCDLKQIIDIARHTELLPQSFLYPYAILGYKDNGYANIRTNRVFKEPYATNLDSYFDGIKTAEEISKLFSNKTKELFTEDFITNFSIDPAFEYERNCLIENSLKPWKNKCKFIMVHGTADITVYYQNAKDYAKVHNEYGGNVTFRDVHVLDDHTKSIIAYFAQSLSIIPSYK